MAEQEPGLGDGTPDSDGGGGRRWLPHGSRAWLIGAVALVAVVGLIAVAALAGPALMRGFGLADDDASEVTPPRLTLGPLAAEAPPPTGTGLTAALAKVSSAKALGTLSGVVADAATGEVLWSRSPDQVLVPGSTQKLLTTAAVLLTVDPTSSIPTRVVSGDDPGSVVLVGGGDPTLSVLAKGSDSVYPGAARLDTLANSVRAAHPEPIRSVTVDVSRFTGDGLATGWDPADIAAGYITPIQPLILDGGRSKPAELDPPRSATPALDAGRALAKRLGADPATVKEAPAKPGAVVLGEVQSPSIGDLVENALRISDNVLAEALARQVAIARGVEPSFAGAARAVRDTLTEAGFDTADAKIFDGSGLSVDDRVSARLLGEIMTAASGPSSDARSARLRPLLAGLPVAGGDGTLDDRFTVPDATVGRGFVRAKTGTLTGVSALAGVVTDADGRLLSFALMSNGTSPADSRPRLDAIAAALRTCGCR